MTLERCDWCAGVRDDGTALAQQTIKNYGDECECPVCPLCGDTTEGDAVHQACSDYEQMRADLTPSPEVQP